MPIEYFLAKNANNETPLPLENKPCCERFTKLTKKAFLLLLQKDGGGEANGLAGAFETVVDRKHMTHPFHLAQG